MRTSIGVQRTLDASPPIFTALAIPDPTAANDRLGQESHVDRKQKHTTANVKRCKLHETLYPHI